MPKKTVIITFIISLLVVLLLAPFASPWPDGLEKVAEKYGIIKYEKEPFIKGLFPDYEATGVKSPYLKVVIPGVFGVAITFAFVSGVYLILAPRRAK